MTKYFLTWILSITVTTVCLCQTIKGKVVRVADGDTIAIGLHQ